MQPGSLACISALLRLVVRRYADRLVVVSWIEFCAIAAPGGVLQDAVDLAQPGRRKPQRNDLPDPHHDVPAYDFDAGRGKGFVKALLLELRVELAQRARLVVLQNIVSITALSVVGAAFSAGA